MRLPLTTLEVFNAVVENMSLSRAADSLGVKPSAVSHQIKALEKKLGAAVLQRTTRSLRLTEVGRALYADTAPAFDRLNSAYTKVKKQTDDNTEILRLHMTPLCLKVLVEPVLKPLLVAHPHIELDLAIVEDTDNNSRFEKHPCFLASDSKPIGCNVLPVKEALVPAIVVSPMYLKKHKTITEPCDLSSHDSIRYKHDTAEWCFVKNGLEYTLDKRSKVVTQSYPMQFDLALAGVGLIRTYQECCLTELAEGKLISVLNNYLPNTSDMNIYYRPGSKYSSAPDTISEFLATNSGPGKNTQQC